MCTDGQCRRTQYDVMQSMTRIPHDLDETVFDQPGPSYMPLPQYTQYAIPHALLQRASQHAIVTSAPRQQACAAHRVWVQAEPR